MAECNCGQEHFEGADYFVSVVREPYGVANTRLLLGPWADHATALRYVEPARKVAEELDSRAIWYAYGTVAIKDATQRGILNPFFAQL